MTSTLGQLLLGLYRPAFEHHFRDHPDKDRIVEALASGGNSPEQVDLWFTEAEQYTWKALNGAAAKLPVSEGGTVTIQVLKEAPDE